MRLDGIDREILFQLQRDGRLSNVELARRVGLTPPPCLRRVKRLEEAGVITGYRAVVDPAAVGRGLEVFVDVDINANDLKTVQAFETTAAGYDEVVELRRMFGHPDYPPHRRGRPCRLRSLPDRQAHRPAWRPARDLTHHHEEAQGRRLSASAHPHEPGNVDRSA